MSQTFVCLLQLPAYIVRERERERRGEGGREREKGDREREKERRVTDEGKANEEGREFAVGTCTHSFIPEFVYLVACLMLPSPYNHIQVY